jgi:hypothetical protein
MFRYVKIAGRWQIFQSELSEPGSFFTHSGFYKAEQVEEWGPVIPTPVKYTPRKRPETIEVGEVKAAADDHKLKDETLGESLVYEDFEEVLAQRPNDCPVVALANVARLSYKDAKLKCFHHGWSSTIGLTKGFLEVVLDKLGYRTVIRRDLMFGRVEDMRLPSGVFLVSVKAHVMPAVNGEVLNVQGCHGQVVEEVHEVFLNEKS